jgi:site-specific recombinase XerD
MSRTTPIPESIQKIAGYPDKLVVYQTPASKFYWVRTFYQGRYFTKSTKSTNLSDAKKFAVKFYETTLLSAVLNQTSDSTKAFTLIGRKYLDSIKDTQLKSTYRNDDSRFKLVLSPFFNEQDINTITNAQISKLVEKLRKGELSVATQKHYIVVLRKIMKYAIANDWMEKLPVFPKISGKLQTGQKRDYFTDDEYDAIVRMSEVCAVDREVVRGVEITLEMKYLIQFCINSFIRPSDLRVIKHKHIKINGTNREGWVTLTHPATKTNANEVQAMPATVGIYRKICELRQQTQKKIYPDDYLFFPQYPQRDTAMAVIARLFRHIIKKTNIEEMTGKKLTLYSLRHTSIMMRLVKGNVNTLHLARNARTSQAMIDQFYASHLTTDQVRQHLHSFTKKQTHK